MNKKQKKECSICKKEYFSSYSTSRYCSESCRYESNKRRLNNLNYKQWQLLVEQCLEICNYKCTKCSSSENLQCHHKTPKVFGGSDLIDNLEMLCQACHVKEHLNLALKAQ